MKLYQVEHDNCEPYEENYHYREDKVYKDKEKLVQRLTEEGYEEEQDSFFGQQFVKDFVIGIDVVRIHELTIED
ncbi:BofL [Staphylococcus phage Twort]|uniref:BofL n=2 Tax=Staphylococcus phage Twort (strain DSM 17442 / HER 48) TaxID=2908167 RepID=A0A6H0X552_BPTWO|nr:ORF171 [Staphylococcus phage Twort]AAX92442.1 ORF171 [Staphylococcus phage Twort]QIW89033.1 BofL [Staphylococcus phage Twort]